MMIAIGLPSFLRSPPNTASTTNATTAKITAPAYAPTGFRFSMLSWMNRVSVCVRPSMFPETMTTAPNSPSTRAVVSVTP